MSNPENRYLLPIDVIKAHEINTQIDIVYWSCNLYRQEIADILYSPDGTTQLLQLMADQLNAVKDEFEKYKRNSVPLPESREDRLPEKAPILYADWKKLPENKWKTSLDCMDEVWGEYIKAGRLYQDDLKWKNGLDPALMKACSDYVWRNSLSRDELLPPPKSKRIDAVPIDRKKINKVRSLSYRK